MQNISQLLHDNEIIIMHIYEFRPFILAGFKFVFILISSYKATTWSCFPLHAFWINPTEDYITIPSIG
jgi:hypothetical protein